ncbi:YceI family protein [Chryseobacterium oryctis]|uniref:Lipid/polyisoprenoid-binding YceI-like domain-containing protein n=1 Tax=Chryseobacterium oryctis TaxID=2952618 RepID=A0ABT3HIU2_9FLAO|nr:YceI family protein [Chryseobacterium oryctis]MCW3159704.1 hypothetical protein [Chryseobacterium oryctis]
MKPFLTYILVFLGILASAQENYIQINGSTNVNNFKCVNKTFKSTIGTHIIAEKQLPSLALKVEDFDCKNKIMTSDFQKTLLAEKYPYLNIKFLSIDKNDTVYNAKIEVKMIDKSKTYNVAFCLENGKLIGKRTVKFSDFNIKTPKKMGGMIVVKDDLNLEFALSANL